MPKAFRAMRLRWLIVNGALMWRTGENIAEAQTIAGQTQELLDKIATMRDAGCRGTTPALWTLR